MRGGNRSATGAIASLVWLSIAACAPTADVDGGLGWEVIDSAGVAVTTITGDVNELPEWTLSEPIAVVSGDAEPFLGRVGEVELLSGGRFVLEDEQSDQLHLFDADAMHLGVLAGQGDGPGEFQTVAELSVDEGDTIYAHDTSHDRLTALHPEAGFLRSVPFLDVPDARPPRGVWRLAPDRLLVHLVRNVESDEPYPRRAHEDVRLFLYDGQGERIGGPIEFAGEYSTEGETFVAPAPFSNRRVIAVGRGRVAYGSGMLYELSIRDRELGSLAEIRWAREPEPVAEAEVEAMRKEVDSVYSGLDVPDELLRDLREGMMDPVMIPETKPVLGPVFMDSSHRIWVSEFVPDGPGGSGAGREWHVLSPTGEPLGRFTLPPDTEMVAVAPDRILLVYTDGLDVEHVQVRSLIR